MIREYFLPDEEMIEVLECEWSDKLIIGGVVDFEDACLILWTGTLERIFALFEIFEPCGTGVLPDFTQFKVIDYGNTLQFGEYEAAVDAVLEEVR